jgi:hypothetical protein
VEVLHLPPKPTAVVVSYDKALTFLVLSVGGSRHTPWSRWSSEYDVLIFGGSEAGGVRRWRRRRRRRRTKGGGWTEVKEGEEETRGKPTLSPLNSGSSAG